MEIDEQQFQKEIESHPLVTSFTNPKTECWDLDCCVFSSGMERTLQTNGGRRKRTRGNAFDCKVFFGKPCLVYLVSNEVFQMDIEKSEKTADLYNVRVVPTILLFNVKLAFFVSFESVE